MIFYYLRSEITNMSSVDIRCDLAAKYGNGIGEVKLETEGIHTYQPTLATIIASEVVNDIIDNALDLAISRPDLEWEKSCKMVFKDEHLLDDQSIRQKIETFDFNSPKLEEPSLAPNIKQIIEGLNTISVNPVKKNEAPVRLDIEMKRLLSEMMSPPYPIINYEAAPRKDGVGDQPPQSTIEQEMQYLGNRSEDILVDPEQTRVVEKKSRVTDLVMNSKQVLSELLMDENSRQKLEEWEEANEEVIRVIELDCVQPGEEPFRASNREKPAVCKKPEIIKILPEDIPLPDDDSNEGETTRSFGNQKYIPPEDDEEGQILQLPNEDIMDIVDLSREAFQEEERQLEEVNEINGGKGDVYNDVNITASQQPLPELNETAITIQEPIKPSESSTSKKEGKKKKWNIGTRIWGFIKKRQKNKEECTTSRQPKK